MNENKSWPLFRRQGRKILTKKTVFRIVDGKQIKEIQWETEGFLSVNAAKRKSVELQKEHGTHLGCGVLEVIRD